MARVKLLHHLITHSEEETHQEGFRFGKQLSSNSIVSFFGDLGAGKTTFIRGIVSAWHRTDIVHSPTFTYLNIYEGNKTIYHFDLYRLQSEREFLTMGFDEYLFADGICCIEWSERIERILPKEVINVKIEHLADNRRNIFFS